MSRDEQMSDESSGASGQMELSFITEDLQTARAYADDMLTHVTEEMWFQQPAEGINPIAWQVGHMAVAEYGLCLKRIRGTREEDAEFMPADFLQAFGKGSLPAANAEDYPPSTELLRVFHEVHRQVMAELVGLTSETLAESAGAPHPMFSTKSGALRFSAKHEMLHVGQVALLRRLLGGASLR